jgi:hypothetical protein
VRAAGRRGFWMGWRPWVFSLMGTGRMRQTEDTWEMGVGAIYEVIVDGVAYALAPARPKQRLVGMGPRKLRQCLV